MYMTPKHSVNVGLVAPAIVSSWTIVATLLSSTTDMTHYLEIPLTPPLDRETDILGTMTEAYLRGVSGPY
jgi:hypothetical protein